MQIAQILPVMTLGQRRSWARRQGHPQWLWPEVDRADWVLAMAAIARVASDVLGGGALPVLSGFVAALGLAGYVSGMGPVLGAWVAAGLVQTDAVVAEAMARHLAQNSVRNTMLRAVAERALVALARAGVTAVVLKGGHTAGVYFPAPGCRAMSDIDVLIAPGDVDRAAGVLMALDYICTQEGPRESCWQRRGVRTEPRDLTMVSADDPWSIDLHTSLDIATGPTRIVRLDAADPVGCAVPIGGMSPCAMVLPQPLLLIHLAAHAGMGLHNLTLLRLVEIVLVIRCDGASGALDWAAFTGLAERIGALGAVWPALALANQLAPGTVPPRVLAQCAKGAPRRVRAVVSALTPATAQRIDRNSLSEHFMWTQGIGGLIRHMVADLLPRRDTWRVYAARAAMVSRGRIGR